MKRSRARLGDLLRWDGRACEPSDRREFLRKVDQVLVEHESLPANNPEWSWLGEVCGIVESRLLSAGIAVVSPGDWVAGVHVPVVHMSVGLMPVSYEGQWVYAVELALLQDAEVRRGHTLLDTTWRDSTVGVPGTGTLPGRGRGRGQGRFGAGVVEPEETRLDELRLMGVAPGRVQSDGRPVLSGLDGNSRPGARQPHR